MHKAFSTLYDLAPYPLQALIFNRYTAVLKRSRYSEPFRSLTTKLHTQEYIGEKAINAIQLSALRRILVHSSQNVPHYAELFERLRFDPYKISSLNELQRLPVLTKSDVKMLGAKLHATRGFSRPISYGATSGTTGSPLNLIYDRPTVLMTDALDWRQKTWAGIEHSSEHAYILGRTIVRPDRKPPPYWQFDKSMRNLWISAFHLGDEFIEPIVNAIIRYRIRSIEGYPSSLATLAQLIRNKGVKLPMKAAFTSSETLYEWQRQIIEEAFDCQLYDFYGLAERIAFATECREGRSKHLNPEIAVNEITDKDGDPVTVGESGLLTGTTLCNFAMPLIRYQTSDVTAFKTAHCTCGRAFQQMTNVETKSEDLIRTPEGKTIPPSVLTHPFKTIQGIKKSQIIQETFDEINVKVVVDLDVSTHQLDELQKALSLRIGEGINITVEIVDDIAPGPNSKYRWVISKLSKFKS